MKVKIKIEKEFDVKTLIVRARVRYWEDTTVNGIEDTDGKIIPCRSGDHWCPEININTGVILNWKQGVSASIHYKVCDDGDYSIYDAEGNFILKKEDYVPSIMCPTEEGFGDYIIMEIEHDGHIKNWTVDFSGLTQEDE
jgi:hypothetical protein